MFLFDFRISLDVLGQVIKTGISQIILGYTKFCKCLQAYTGITQAMTSSRSTLLTSGAVGDKPAKATCQPLRAASQSVVAERIAEARRNHERPGVLPGGVGAIARAVGA